MKKKFRVVFIKDTNEYGIQFQDSKGEWLAECSFSTFTREINGEVAKDGLTGDVMYFLSENVLWRINKLMDLGYEMARIHRVATAQDFWNGR